MGIEPKIGQLNYGGVFQIYDYREIEYLPENIFDDLSIRKLSIADCWKLKELPESIGNLSYLTELEIIGCISELRDFNKIPDSIGQLKCLKRFTIWSTAIQSLPDTIGNLESLKELEICSNWNLHQLPETISNLKKLEYLNIEGGKLTSLPENIGEMQSLQYLYMAGNNLRFLPDSIGKLQNIRYIDVKSNMLETLPESIWDCKNIDISDNPRWNDWMKECQEVYYEALANKKFNVSE